MAAASVKAARANRLRAGASRGAEFTGSPSAGIARFRSPACPGWRRADDAGPDIRPNSPMPTVSSPSVRPARFPFARLLAFGALAAALLAVLPSVHATPAEDAQAVADLDTRYQDAVEKNDPVVMDQILADDFTLVIGRGKAFNKADLLKSARDKDATYELQREIEGTQKVRVHGDTAVVTALLHLKGTRDGKPFDYKLWFSDTYVRTPKGWKYFFGQASLPLPKE